MNAFRYCGYPGKFFSIPFHINATLELVCDSEQFHYDYTITRDPRRNSTSQHIPKQWTCIWGLGYLHIL